MKTRVISWLALIAAVVVIVADLQGQTTYNLFPAIRVGAGSAAAPSMAFSADPTTGRYRVGANNPGEAVSGTLKYDWNGTRLKLASGYHLDVGSNRLTTSDLLDATKLSGTVPVANGGLNLTAATDDNVPVGNGTTWQSKALANCTGVDKALMYDTSTNSFACNSLTAVVALVDGATPALDASAGTVFTLSASGDRTIAVPSNPTSGRKIIIQHFASGGARTLALNTGAGGFRFGSDITGLTATASGKTDYIGCIYNATDSKWDVVAVVKGY